MQKISRFEAVSLTVNLLCCKLFLLTPSFFIENAGSASLLTVLMIYAIALLFFLFFKKRTDSNLFSLMPSSFLKRLFHFTALLLTLFCCTVNLSLLIYFLKLLAFPRSPFLFLAIPFGLGMIVCAKGGIQSIGKTNGFFVPILFGVLLLLLALHLKKFSFFNLFPFFGKGVSETFVSGIFMLSSLFEILILFYLTEDYNGNISAVAFPSLFISALLYLFVIGATLLTDTSRTLPAVFTVMQTGLFGRSDGLFLILYTLSGLLYLSSMLFFATRMFQKAFLTPHWKPLCTPLALLCIAFSEITFLNPEGQAFLKHAGLFLWLIPFLIPLILMMLPKKKKETPHV